MTSSKNDLRLARVALLETRMGSELSALVRKHGGDPVCIPSVSECPADASSEVNALIDRLLTGLTDLVLFQTGVSVDELVRVAESLGRRADLVTGLAMVTRVCRGPKPAFALKKLGLKADVLVPEPHTTEDMISTMLQLDLPSSQVTVVHHGERNDALIAALSPHSKRLDELVLYRWDLPDDVSPLSQLVCDLIDGRYDAIAFTSQVQVRHLFLIAARIGLAESLAAAMNHQVVTAAVGPTCAAELRSYGVTPHVTPERPKMGHMVSALADHFARSHADERVSVLV